MQIVFTLSLPYGMMIFRFFLFVLVVLPRGTNAILNIDIQQIAPIAFFN